MSEPDDKQPEAPKGPQPRTTITLFVLEDGNVGMRVQGEAPLGDIILAAGFLQLESSHQFQRMKRQQENATVPAILRPNGASLR